MTEEQLARVVEILSDPEKASALLDPAEREALDRATRSLKNVVHIDYRQVEIGFLAAKALFGR
jgi:hypothetical protein